MAYYTNYSTRTLVKRFTTNLQGTGGPLVNSYKKAKEKKHRVEIKEKYPGKQDYFHWERDGVQNILGKYSCKLSTARVTVCSYPLTHNYASLQSTTHKLSPAQI